VVQRRGPGQRGDPAGLWLSRQHGFHPPAPALNPGRASKNTMKHRTILRDLFASPTPSAPIRAERLLARWRRSALVTECHPVLGSTSRGSSMSTSDLCRPGGWPYADLPVRASQSSAPICRTFLWRVARARTSHIAGRRAGPDWVRWPWGFRLGAGRDRLRGPSKASTEAGTVGTAGSHGSQPVQER
jgi:hypothetical protein